MQFTRCASPQNTSTASQQRAGLGALAGVSLDEVFYLRTSTARETPARDKGWKNALETNKD